jgi:hypothetical protein
MYRTDGRATSLEVTDLYLASYLLLKGCRLVKVECVPTGGAVSCALTFSHPGLPAYEDAFHAQSATVNLIQFRSAYNQVNGYVHQAKKSFDRARRRGDTRAVRAEDLPDSEGVPGGNA